MDQITAFQAWIGAPVIGLLQSYWTVIAILALAVVAWFVRPRAVRNDGADVNLLGSEDSSDGDGGDGGGGSGD
ncbi:MAG: hypothetical protein HY834_09630 [Devosia nanyangense]|uniref:Uncharacterized protein n=1 Tax=Devosia nanyangense TaxID=1228055 RepID=A0A933NYZ7_9HYPH|nr:hypothetical protein [Devosia nanyangense]